MRLFQPYEFNLLPVIYPYAEWDQRTRRQPGEKAILEKESQQLGMYCQKPCDMEGYAAFVQSLVERYDGDGVDDMPGLERPIKFWEVMNEPFAGKEETKLEQVMKAPILEIRQMRRRERPFFLRDDER